MKLVKWLLVLLVVAGALYFATSVKVGHSTLLQRITSGERKDGKTASTHAKVDSAGPSSSPTGVATDVHTTKEQNGLERLIEKRLEHASDRAH